MFKKVLLTGLFIFLFTQNVMANSKKYIVAHDATWPPMEYMDEKRNIVGYSVDYIDAVAKEAGIEIVHKSVAWDGIFAGLGTKYDVISSSVTITEPRKKIVDFTEPYYEVKQAVITAKGSNISSPSDLELKRLGSQIGTTGFMATRKIKDAKATSFDEIGLAVAALAANKLDAVVCDDATARSFILANPEYANLLELAFILPADVPEYYGFAVAKGNQELVDILNKGIAGVKSKGLDKEIQKKWNLGE